ncbi:hypothetical protein C7H19_24870 [Aphanothece hegewaldii CCALA 016]|uniref:Uncharacterized protein n=2 Tax=Aphanothece TaxID=1121 RepID=A0A2T1LQF7_9CHRO|nr:hypothetical protein C7H19_24870 [Aphanothece hegewaldii CCALA 016]
MVFWVNFFFIFDSAQLTRITERSPLRFPSVPKKIKDIVNFRAKKGNSRSTIEKFIMLKSCPQCGQQLNPPIQSINRQVCYHCGWSQEVNVESKKNDQTLNKSKNILFLKSFNLFNSFNSLYTVWLEFMDLFQSHKLPEQKLSNRLYRGFIYALKTIQVFGFLGGLILGLLSFDKYDPILWILLSILLILASYLSTQGMIAVVDLLSRIEENIRKLNVLIDSDRSNS